MAVNYDILLDKVRNLGMEYKAANTFVKFLKEDEEAFPDIDEEKKKWALERGFFPGRIELFGLTEDNYLNFLPDYNYFMLHLLNNFFWIWLNKTTLKYVLNSNNCEKSMPEYYLYIENQDYGGNYTYLMDCPKDIKKDKDFIWNLLQQKKILAMKPNSGTSGGLGFIKLELRDNKLYENNKQISIERFEEIRDTMRNYIITEYVQQHHELDAIWPDSECTLRVVMCKDPAPDRFAPATWSCAASYARFGIEASGGVSNLTAGGVGVGFDFETGLYKDFGVKYKQFTPDGNWILYEHPDSKIKWKGLVIPNWDYVKEQIFTICQHISSLDYLGFDVVITEEGMKILEINTLPTLGYAQIMCQPTLSNPKIRAFYEHKGLRKFNGADFYQAYVDSIE